MRMSGAATESLLLQSPHVDSAEAVFRHARLQVLAPYWPTTTTCCPSPGCWSQGP